MGLCLAMLGDRAAADDAAQDAFLKAFESLASFRREAGFATWLHRIAVNRCLDARRQAEREGAVSWDELLGKHGEILSLRLGGAEAGPQQRLEDADLAARILACLPENQRLALTLREVDGLSYEEIAETLGCTVDSVKARLRRARAELEQNLRHFWAGGDV